MMKIGYKGRSGPEWLRDKIINLEISWRYMVIGVYPDRHFPLIRIYLLPFTRITIGRINGPLAEKRRSA